MADSVAPAPPDPQSLSRALQLPAMKRPTNCPAGICARSSVSGGASDWPGDRKLCRKGGTRTTLAFG